VTEISHKQCPNQTATGIESLCNRYVLNMAQLSAVIEACIVNISKTDH